MGSSIVAANTPARVELEAGKKYWFCQCGRSANQPFCDGSHRGSEFTPLEFTVEAGKPYFLCRCKQSANQPFCDGTHNRVDNAQVGKPFGG